jgi:hypothetical protein
MSDLVEKVNDGNFEQVVLHSSVQGVSSWQLIFQQSKVNNGAYDGDRLPAQNWHWPQGTWLQKRLRYLRRSNDRDATEYTAKKLQ